ncbi:hypothetical protein OCK74_12190 [Chitinophagaceae bacterium LB-8]|uniref:DUF928 domain-containing protein n=1 Tax=Paraflavisolibacter caeni TaxID=2982496 RepID=A0A9X2XWE3_9BACT|nr:hypothetical protein [Paraflavisolibacter caeni]MCU7549882.1 hypothetical protein [Paraflavisolibacter caeni]
MKKLMILSSLLVSLCCEAQLLINLQTAPVGMVQKSQLWNMAVSNINNTNLTFHIEVIMSDVSAGRPVLSAVTEPLTLPSGTKQLNASSFAPIQYNILSAAYNIDQTPSGLLPVGNFEVCYRFLRHLPEDVENIAEECQEITVEPISPPQLIYPYDQAAIEVSCPQLSWLPPAPVSLFTNLTYDLQLVEIFASQTAEDAIQKNLPVFIRQSIPATNLLYPSSAPALQADKQYAWRVTAKNNSVQVAQSETWQFNMKQSRMVDNLQRNLPYAKLEKNVEGGFALFFGEIRFDYFNDSEDSVWHISCLDLTSTRQRPFSFDIDSIPLIKGQNLVKFNVRDHYEFIDKHLYLLEIKNSRNEIWHLRFEYRKPEE